MTSDILQVVTDTDRRGAQVFATDLHAALEQRGRAVRTVALAPGRAGGLDLPTLGPDARSLSTLRALRREIARADVVVGHGSTTLPTCALTSIATKTPFVYRQISDSLFWANTRARRLRVRMGMARAADIVALWSGSAATLCERFGVHRERVTVIPNGVPPERYPPVDPNQRGRARAALGLSVERTTVAYIGALVPEKGVDVAIEAVGLLSDVQLLVVGAGPELGQLEALATARAPGRVVFVGSLNDPNSAYTAADVVVLPSRGGDSMPATLIEAGFAGVPVVATPVQGIPEIVVAGKTGEIVAIDDADALKAGITRILDDAPHRQRVIQAAHEHCSARFAIDPVAAAWDEVLGDVVSRRARS